MSTSPKKPLKAASSPRSSGDFQVLRQGIEKARDTVHISRMELASCLDRLGEHYARHHEFDEAMDAFTEALHEKRSVLSHILPENLWSSKSALSPPLVVDFEDKTGGDSFDNLTDEIIMTLRSLGNVHSLRGEQDEAMRYFTEITNLRARKTEKKADSGDQALFSGLGIDEDNSAQMAEINEDMKALGDMFQIVSFRDRENGLLTQRSRMTSTLRSSAKENTSCSSNKRRKSDSYCGIMPVIESEPFKRSSSLCLYATNSDLSEALRMYKAVLESYTGPKLEQHKDIFNSLALRVDLLAETGQQDDLGSTSKNRFDKNLDLAVEIYQHTHTAQVEMITTERSGSGSNPQACKGIASTLIRMGGLYFKLGRRVEELSMYKQAKDVYCRAFGDKHPFVAGARKNIGMVMAERGEYDNAMDQFKRAKEIYLAVNRGDEISRNVASAISCMGNVKNRIGELDEALELYVEALRIYKAIQAKPTDNECDDVCTLDVTATLKVIGMVHSRKGNLDTAMSVFLEALTLLRTYGDNATASCKETTSSVLTRMASIYAKKGELDHAMDRYKEAYEISVQNHGTTSHQEVAGILHYIGGIFHKRSNFDEAMNCYQEAIRIYHETLGPGNAAVAGTLVMVGSIHYKRRNLDSAKMFYREALRLNRNAYGFHHPDVAPILKSIGTILTKKGEYQEAYDMFRDVLSIKCTIHGTGHPEVASAYKSLGNVHYKLGELADAERQYRHALNIFRRTRGEDHADTIAAKTTIDHIRYWMKERGQRKQEQRQARSRALSEGRDEEIDKRSF